VFAYGILISVIVAEPAGSVVDQAGGRIRFWTGVAALWKELVARSFQPRPVSVIDCGCCGIIRTRTGGEASSLNETPPSSSRGFIPTLHYRVPAQPRCRLTSPSAKSHRLNCASSPIPAHASNLMCRRLHGHFQAGWPQSPHKAVRRHSEYPLIRFPECPLVIDS